MKTRDNFVATPTAERSLNPQNLVGNVDGNELLIQTRQGGSVLDDPNVLNVLIHTTTLRGIVETFLGSGQKIIWGDEKMVRRRALSSFPPIIYINPTIKDPEHVVQLIAHELGHETSGFPIATLFPKLGPQVHPQDLPTLISTTVHDGYISEGGASTLEEITAQELREQGMRSFTPFGNVDWTTKIPVLEAIETPEEFRLFLHSLSAERAARHDNFLTLNTNMLEQTVRKQFVDHFKKRK